MRIILVMFFLFIPFQSHAAQKFPDLLNINHISAKGRVQDAKYNPNNVVIDELIKSGKLCIPYLINLLESQRVVKPGVLDFWPYVEERHLALKILTDFFLDATWKKSTVSDFCFNSLISFDSHSGLAEWEILLDHFTPTEWRELKQKWEIMWMENKDQIIWDSEDLFFRIQGKELRPCNLSR